MKTMTTDQYPTRYFAGSNPGVWVDHENPEQRGGFEVSSYREPWESDCYPEHPHLWHGIDIDLFWHAEGGVVVDCNVTLPNEARTARRFTQWVKGYDAIERARKIAKEWLENHRREGQLGLFGGVS